MSQDIGQVQELVEIPVETLNQLRTRLQDLAQREAINTKLLGYMETDLDNARRAVAERDQMIAELQAQVASYQTAAEDADTGSGSDGS